MQLGDLSRRLVFHDVDAGDEVAVAESDLAPRAEPEELLGGILPEILLLDIEDAGEGNLARAGRGVLRIVIASSISTWSSG